VLLGGVVVEVVEVLGGVVVGGVVVGGVVVGGVVVEGVVVEGVVVGGVVVEGVVVGGGLAGVISHAARMPIPTIANASQINLFMPALISRNGEIRHLSVRSYASFTKKSSDCSCFSE